MSVAFTVRAMDAGPVLAQARVAVDGDVQAPQLLRDLFRRGAKLLLAALPDVWSGAAARAATPQVAAGCLPAGCLTLFPRLPRSAPAGAWLCPAEDNRSQPRAWHRRGFWA